MSIAPKRSRVVFQKLEQDLVKLSSKPRAENVHRFRTGTRRLQILLGELSPKLDRNQKKLLKLLGRIRKRAGKVRDLDVQLAALRSLKIPQEPRRKTQLVNRLIELRGRQEKKLRRAVDKDAVREIRKRLKRAGKIFNPEASRDPLAVARGMLEAIDRGDAPVTEALLHQYRILSKRARYAAEFAEQSAEAEAVHRQAEAHPGRVGRLARLAHADPNCISASRRSASVLPGSGTTQRDRSKISPCGCGAFAHASPVPSLASNIHCTLLIELRQSRPARQLRRRDGWVIHRKLLILKTQ